MTTTTASRPQTSPARAVRTSLRLSVPVAVLASAVLAAPGAFADVPKGFSDPDDVSVVQFLIVLVALPLALALLITLAVYIPALVRGEKVAPNASPVDDQWFGGPRSGTGELEQPSEKSGTGGASGRW